MVFIANKYTVMYYKIIHNANSRFISPSTYTEKHHIIPKSLGGGNNSENLITLTAREHFICHWLLTKLVDGDARTKMAYACRMMMSTKTAHQNRHVSASKVYETLKLRLHHILKDRVFTDDWREKLSISASIRSNSESIEVRERRTVKFIEFNQTRKGMKKPYISGDKNTFSTDATKQKIKQTNMLKYGFENQCQIPYTCEHCGKSGYGLAGYKRWHGDNCKKLIT